MGLFSLQIRIDLGTREKKLMEKLNELKDPLLESTYVVHGVRYVAVFFLFYCFPHYTDVSGLTKGLELNQELARSLKEMKTDLHLDMHYRVSYVELGILHGQVDFL